uniref:Zgc:113210 n=1 Tax=Cyprinus carpio carpio TaxID=630221 RepID=A0A9J7XTF9_CYPCA
MDIMNTAEFQTQLTSIMETLAKTAVVEIRKLFEENASFLRLEISRFTSENESLKKKCHLLENELQCARKSAGKMNGTEAPSCHAGLTDTGHRPAIDSVFGKEWCMNLWRHEESHVGEQGDTHRDSAVIIGEPVNLLEEEPDMIMIKEEASDDCSSGRNEEDQDTVKGAIQEEIKTILPELDFNKLQNLVSHLSLVVGVEKTEDLSLVEVSDLQDFLEPIQCRKAGSMTLTPLSSNESLHEQPFIPSFIKSNWVRSFQVPWDRMQTALVQATSTGERARPGPRREFVRIVVAAMQAHCPNPNLTACGEVARNIVSAYPLTFGDISEEGEQLGNGFSCLQRQLKTRVEHVNRDVLEHRIRRPRRPSMKRAGEQDGYTMKKVRCKVDSYGCINWQPSSIPEGETAESLEMKRKVAAEIFQSAGPKAAELPNIDDLMQQTYVYQRHMINSCPPPTISEIEGHWPFLFTERGLCRHFKVLTGIDIRSRFNETLIDKSKRILNYFSRQRLKWTEEIQSMLSEIDDANATDNNRIAISAILLMMKYFKEKDNAVFILADETSTKMSIENEISLPATPRLIMLGETLLTSSKWFISIEGRVTHSIEDQLDFAAALSVFFGCFYVFNIEYQESASATLELIQRFFVRINPEGTKCTSKSGTSRRTGSAVQRKPQNFNTRVATFMQRLSEFEWKTFN